MKRPQVSRRANRLAAGCALMLVSLAPAAMMASPASAGSTVSGGGSGFAALEIQQWTADVARQPYNLSVNYTASSSGGGRINYANGLYQYGASDIVYNAEDGNVATQVQSTHPFKYVTVSAGAVGVMYNVVINGQRFTGLNLSRQEVCQIFTGELTTWNQLANTPGDQALAGVTAPIKVITRSDSAGESYVMSQYCLAVDPGDWKPFQQWVVANQGNINYSDTNMDAGQPVSYWPSELINGDVNTQQAPGADGVANVVADPNVGSNSVTFDAAGYAKVRGYPLASVEDGVPGNFVQPNANSVQIALSYAAANSLGTFDLNFNGSSPQAYFPSTYTYVMAPTTIDPATGAVLGQFLCYDIGQGQNIAAQLLYAPLSQQVTALSVAAIQAVPGAPPAGSCGQGGPAPVVGSNGGGTSGGGGGGSGGGTGGGTGGGGSGGGGSGSGSAGAGSGGAGGARAGSPAGGATTPVTAGARGSSSSGSRASGPGGITSGTAGAASVAATAVSSDSGAIVPAAGANTADAGGTSGPVQVALQATPAGSGNSSSGALWYLLVGAGICALGSGAKVVRKAANS